MTASYMEIIWVGKSRATFTDPPLVGALRSIDLTETKSFHHAARKQMHLVPATDLTNAQRTPEKADLESQCRASVSMESRYSSEDKISLGRDDLARTY